MGATVMMSVDAWPAPAVFDAKIEIVVVPAVVGVPERVGAVAVPPTVNQDGKDPVAGIEKLVATGDAVKAIGPKRVPTVAARTLPPVTVTTGAFAAGLIEIVKLAVAEREERVAVTATGKDPVCWVVPVISPVAALSASPVGSVPDVRA